MQVILYTSTIAAAANSTATFLNVAGLPTPSITDLVYCVNAITGEQFSFSSVTDQPTTRLLGVARGTGGTTARTMNIGDTIYTIAFATSLAVVVGNPPTQQKTTNLDIILDGPAATATTVAASASTGESIANVSIAQGSTYGSTSWRPTTTADSTLTFTNNVGLTNPSMILLHVAAADVDPGASNVASGVTYTVNGATETGALLLPAPDLVIAGTAYGPNGTTIGTATGHFSNSTTTIMFTLNINSAPTDATSVVLQDPTNTFGLRRTDTQTVIIASGTAIPHVAPGTYTLPVSGLTPGVTYEYWILWVYLGRTYTEQRFITVPVEPPQQPADTNSPIKAAGAALPPQGPIIKFVQGDEVDIEFTGLDFSEITNGSKIWFTAKNATRGWFKPAASDNNAAFQVERTQGLLILNAPVTTRSQGSLTFNGSIPCLVLHLDSPASALINTGVKDYSVRLETDGTIPNAKTLCVGKCSVVPSVTKAT